MCCGKSCPTCENLKNLVWLITEKISDFSLFDWALTKTGLISLGILIGSVFSKFFRRLAPLMALVFLATCAYTAWRLLLCDD